MLDQGPNSQTALLEGRDRLTFEPIPFRSAIITTRVGDTVVERDRSAEPSDPRHTVRALMVLLGVCLLVLLVIGMAVRGATLPQVTIVTGLATGLGWLIHAMGRRIRTVTRLGRALRYSKIDDTVSIFVGDLAREMRPTVARPRSELRVIVCQLRVILPVLPAWNGWCAIALLEREYVVLACDREQGEVTHYLDHAPTWLKTCRRDVGDTIKTAGDLRLT